MGAVSQFRRCLEGGDVEGLVGIWRQVSPALPLPESRDGAEIVMHRARTEAQSVTFRARAWSHRWLTERGLPSGLPDHHKPRAERLYPVAAPVVGISVNFGSELLKPAATEIRRAMSDAVEDAYAEGRKDPVFVKARMQEARAKTIRSLFGRRA